LELAGRYPNEPKILCDLAQAYALAGDNSNATRYAEAYAAWEPKPTTGGLREKLCQQVLKKFNADKPAFNRAEGYEFILRQDKTDKEASSKARQELAAKIVALNPDSTLGLNTLANECLLSNQPDRAIECARRGQQLNPRDTTWRALLADAYMAKKDYANVVAECDAILASNPDDSRISALRALAARMQEQKSK
jgi:predicted Zn-dependent protease